MHLESDAVVQSVFQKLLHHTRALDYAIRSCGPDRATCSNLHVIIRRGARYYLVIDTLSPKFKLLYFLSVSGFWLQQTQRCRRFVSFFLFRRGQGNFFCVLDLRLVASWIGLFSPWAKTKLRRKRRWWLRRKSALRKWCTCGDTFLDPRWKNLRYCLRCRFLSPILHLQEIRGRTFAVVVADSP